MLWISEREFFCKLLFLNLFSVGTLETMFVNFLMEKSAFHHPWFKTRQAQFISAYLLGRVAVKARTAHFCMFYPPGYPQDPPRQSWTMSLRASHILESFQHFSNSEVILGSWSPHLPHYMFCCLIHRGLQSSILRK